MPALVVAGVAAYYVTTRRTSEPSSDPAVAIDLSKEQELALGRESYRQIIAGSQLVSTGSFADTVRDVGGRIASVTGASGIEWELTVIDSDEVSASCLPGGKVLVSTGLGRVTETPAGLAIILGHVIAHAVGRHGAARIVEDRLARLGSRAPGADVSDLDVTTRRMVMGAFGVGSRFGVLLPFSREQEAAADHMGLLYVARACFDPTEAPQVWDRMERAGGGAPPEFLSIHPGDGTRRDALQAWMSEALAARREHCDDHDSE